jgi:hypothetical protein
MQGQNLVLNPSFENFSCCPSPTVSVSVDNLACATTWFRADATCSPDYFNPCDGSGIFSSPSNSFGYQSAHSGVCYAGFYTFNKYDPNSSRDYIETQLSSTLLANEMYLVSFYISLANNPQYSTNTIGVHFSSTQINGSGCNIINVSPQVENKLSNALTDTMAWIFISDTLYPDGGEKYMTIGNFKRDSLSDTLFLYSSTGWNSSYYYIDDVSVVDLGPTGVQRHQNDDVKLFPNPVENELSVECRNFEGLLSVKDILGKPVFKSPFSFNAKIDLTDLKPGVYVIELRNDNKIVIRKFIKE